MIELKVKASRIKEKDANLRVECSGQIMSKSRELLTAEMLEILNKLHGVDDGAVLLVALERFFLETLGVSDDDDCT